MTSDEQFNLLTNRIEGILKLLAVQTVSGKKAGEAAALLERAGLDSQDDRRSFEHVAGLSPCAVVTEQEGFL